MKPITTWGKKVDKVPAQQISNCTIDAMAFASVVRDAVFESRRAGVDYRPGDVLRTITGSIFHR